MVDKLKAANRLMFASVNQNVNFPELEEKIIEFWKKQDIFRSSVEKHAIKGHYVFYEGPPTINGKPGIHHVSTRAIKDLYPRYKTMRGYRVYRRGGWDTHGLPVEVEIEKEIGSTNKQDIEKFGVAEFNKRCRELVCRYIQDWNDLTERIGFWLDLENAYITYKNSYIETCWWVLKSLWERGLLYEDYKNTMHCPRCNTSLAAHEVSQGMKENVNDLSVWAKFPVHKQQLVRAGLVHPTETRAVYFLTWTTTPWSLGANAALAIRDDIEYGLFAAKPFHSSEDSYSELYILATHLAERVFGDSGFHILKTFPSRTLVRLNYEPILGGHIPETEDLATGFRIVADELVSVKDGTGIAHVAPAYGDLEIGRKHGLPTIFSVDLIGRVYSEVRAPDAKEVAGPYTGMFFKSADEQITKELIARGLIYRAERIQHKYPHCWRDDSPLLFFAKKSWYIRTAVVQDKLLSNNQHINWVPEYIKTELFSNWLENNKDSVWAITRERYWGTPLPIWASEDGRDKVCIGSIAELENLTGRQLENLDLHRPYIDEISFQRNSKIYKRIPLTVDAWFDSGVMPYTQLHYPSEDQGQLLQNFPADFICEAIDQTWGWFYSLHTLATLLTDSGDPVSGRQPGPLAHLIPDTSAFKNCVVLGFINDEKGQKMSKSRGNTVNPWHILNKDGADALRWYLYISSSAEKNKSFNPAHVTKVLRNFCLTLWNTYNFFVLYANLDKPALHACISVSGRAEIDRWLVSKLNRLIEVVTKSLDVYDATTASRAITEFVVQVLSNWYVRRSRRRFWKSTNDIDKHTAYMTLYEALVTVIKLSAPMAPFVTEEIYQNLVRHVTPQAPISVHLSDWPEADPNLIDDKLIAEMDILLRIIKLGRSTRAVASVKIRQPLSEMLIRVSTDEELAALKKFERLLIDELNVEQITFLDFNTELAKYKIRPNLPLLGKRLGAKVPKLEKALKTVSSQEVLVNIRCGLNTTIDLGDEVIELEPDMFLIDLKSPEGYAAIESGSYLVALNTTLTPALIKAGQVREVIRFVQNTRKKAGLEVSDYIHLGLDVKGEMLLTLQSHEDFIKCEGLVVNLEFGLLNPSDYTEKLDFDSTTVIITLRRA